MEIAPFMLPAWMQTWWHTWKPAAELHLVSFRDHSNTLGIAPLMVEGSRGFLIGGPDVCDYCDLVVASAGRKVFCACLLEYLVKQGITHLDLNPVRVDSFVLRYLAPEARRLGCQVTSDETDTVYEMLLPATWEDYLQQLKGKHRHEIRRKFRRLHEAGQVIYETAADPPSVNRSLDSFFYLFCLSSKRKAAFMTPSMEAFFRSLVKAMADIGMVKFNFLKIDGAPAAVTLCFDDRATIYLYNNGYDPRFQSLSVGLLGKVMGIRDSISRGRKGYSFLKGKEAYKQRLGGQAVPIYRCQISL